MNAVNVSGDKVIVDMNIHIFRYQLANNITPTDVDPLAG